MSWPDPVGSSRGLLTQTLIVHLIYRALWRIRAPRMYSLIACARDKSSQGRARRLGCSVSGRPLDYITTLKQLGVCAIVSTMHARRTAP